MAKRTLTITKSEIEVSSNSRIESGFYFNHKLYGTLPGCRKTVMLSFSPFAKRIIVRPLYGGNGDATIRPDDWRKIVENSPVVSCRISPVELTPEIRAMAVQDALSITTCPAVTCAKDVHPDFSPRYDEVVMA